MGGDETISTIRGSMACSWGHPWTCIGTVNGNPLIISPLLLNTLGLTLSISASASMISPMTNRMMPAISQPVPKATWPPPNPAYDTAGELRMTVGRAIGRTPQQQREAATSMQLTDHPNLDQHKVSISNVRTVQYSHSPHPEDLPSPKPSKAPKFAAHVVKPSVAASLEHTEEQEAGEPGSPHHDKDRCATCHQCGSQRGSEAL